MTQVSSRHPFMEWLSANPAYHFLNLSSPQVKGISISPRRV
jgi:hypothetical protein